MKLSIVMPVFNEINTIKDIIDIVRNSTVPREITEKELIIVDDYSTDGTRELLRNIDSDDIRVFYHEKNKGKGAGLQTGFSNVTGDIIIIQDADLEYDPNEYTKLLRPIIDNKADVVFGSRFAGEDSHRVLFFWHMMANKTLTVLSNMFSDLHLTDMETCYKVFKKEVIERIEIHENRFGFEPEVTAKIAELAKTEGIRIFEVGISYYGRTFQEGKKIGLKDAFKALWCILKYNTSGFAHLVKYGLNGILVALSQIITIMLIVNIFKLESSLQLNVAHAISVEESIITGFILHSLVTWRYKFFSFSSIVVKFIQFQLITSVSFAIRQVLFYGLINIGINYMTSTIIGIAFAVILNFIGYDRLVYRITKIQKD